MLSRTTYKRQAKDNAISKIRHILEEEDDDEDSIPTSTPASEPTTEPTSEPASEPTSVPTTEPTSEPISVCKNKVPAPAPTDKFNLGFTIRYKSPHKFMKAIQDDYIKTILRNTINNPRDKKDIRVVSTYNLKYRVFDKLNNDEKLKIVSYLLESINKA